ncbi:MAG: hypothetical protein CR988_03280 [Treponema sp.]|nr:MAG: hypothetical protein CR988_03280 [Treponema sp.]
MQNWEIQGKVIEVVKQHTDNRQVLRVELNTRNTSELCSLGATPSNGVTSGCEGCSGCSAGGKHTGVFAVKGNVLDVLNDTGYRFFKNDVLTVCTTVKKQVVQSLIALGIPISLAVIGFSVPFFRIQNEGFAIAGLFLGLISGVAIALSISYFNKTNFLPRVKKIEFKEGLHGNKV